MSPREESTIIKVISLGKLEETIRGVSTHLKTVLTGHNYVENESDPVPYGELKKQKKRNKKKIKTASDYLHLCYFVIITIVLTGIK